MCEQTEINYLDGEVVWVKLGKCWWPGEVFALEKLPPDVLLSFKKPPIACVKFFQENAYEYVKNTNNIYKYNCSRKHEFINKGLYMYRTKHGPMEKFPDDIIRAETAVGGDVEILTREEFQETKKERWSGLFRTTPSSVKKGKSGKGRPMAESLNIGTPHKQMKEKTDYKVHILVQGSKSTPIHETLGSEGSAISTPSTSGTDLTSIEDKPQNENTPQNEDQQLNENTTANTETPKSSNCTNATPIRPTPSSSAPSSAGIYACHACPFTTTRLNVLILHNKTHSVSFVPYIPSPVRKKPVAKSAPKSSPISSKTPKPRKPRKEKIEQLLPKKLQAKKRVSEDILPSVEVKKTKTDEEIKSSLLADWDDDVDEDSNDESSTMVSVQSPEVPVGAESPAVPTPAELPSAQVPTELSPVADKKSSSSPSTEKPESSSDSKYEFCEDEDWPEEADFGRKIPRVKNPVRTEDTKSVGIEEDDVAREVAELLNKTAVPELPSVPEALKIEENFPEPSIVKSPDKNQDKNFEKSEEKATTEAPPTKAIFKTKTFFRSRHSRSQDAIGKYVAEQLNAVDRMDISESDINGSDAVSSPEARDSPPIEPVKMARLAPKIQLKKMKAEAAQLRESGKSTKSSERFLGSRPPRFGRLSQKNMLEPGGNFISTRTEILSHSKPVPGIKHYTDSSSICPIFSAKVAEKPYPSTEALIDEIFECSRGTYDDVEEFEVKRGFIESKSEQDLDETDVTQTSKFEEESSDSITSINEEDVVQTSKLEEETSEFRRETSEYEEVVQTPRIENETQNYGRETSKYEEDEEQRSEYEKETSDFGRETTKFEEEAAEYVRQTSEYKEKEVRTTNFEQEAAEYVRQTSEYKEKEVRTTNFEEEAAEYVRQTSEYKEKEVRTTNFEEEAAEYVRQTSEYKEKEVRTTNFEEEAAEYVRQTSEYKEKEVRTTKFEETSEFNEETSKYDEGVAQSSRFEEETLEFETKSSNYHDEVAQTSTFEAQTSENQNVPSRVEEEMLNSEEETVYEGREESSQLEIQDNPKTHQELIINQESEIEVCEVPVINLPEPEVIEKQLPPIETLPDKVADAKPQNQIQPYMNESTASAVDALLSVSREADRVPRVVSNDLPEDLFEDDNKDTDITEPVDVTDDFNEEMDTQNFLAVNGFEENVETEEVHHVENIPDITDQPEKNLIESPTSEILHKEKNDDTVMDISKPLDQEENNVECVIENVPSESDLQVAEALINLPSTAIQSKTPTEHNESMVMPFSFDHEISQEEIVPMPENVLLNETEIGFHEKEIIEETVEHVEESMPISDGDNLNARFETELEKNENLNAAQSLVQMSESIEHKISVVDPTESKEITESITFSAQQNNSIDTSVNSVEHNLALLSNDIKCETVKPKISTSSQSSSKLLKILEEPCKPRISINSPSAAMPIMRGKEKILNFDVAKSTFISKTPQQKFFIRGKTILNNVNDLTGQEKIVLSRSGNSSQDSSSVQTFTIQTSPDTPSDANTIIIQQKIRKIAKPAVIQPKLTKIKPQTSLVAPVNEVKTVNKTQTTDDAMFDINSMPIVLSEDLLTPESIEKMPVVMSDNIISQSQSAAKVFKPKLNAIEHEKVIISSTSHKPEVKTLLLNPGGEVSKSITPNILSKSSKLRGAKPMLVIDKATGKQKIIMTKAEPVLKEVKQTPTLIQKAIHAPKTEKFIILPTQSASPRPARTQKIVIDPQTGKAHVYVAKGSEGPLSATENKPVSAKLVPSNPEASASGNTVMIITNAQGAQSRIVLTPEHEKILFPNKQQPNISQLKSIAHRLTTPTSAQKTLMTTIAPVRTPTIAPVRPPTRIVPKQKSAIITSKGQLIVGGRLATPAQNIAPMPELRPVSKRIVTSEPMKQAVNKTNPEPIVFLQQKSGAIMQLTAAQFEHLQRTGQIVQKTSAPVHDKIFIQKVRPANEPGPSIKSRARKPTTISPTQSKRVKHEIAIAPAPPPPPLVPALAHATNMHPPALVPSSSNFLSVASSSSGSGFSEFDNFEEMLPSTAIARQLQEPVMSAPPELVAAPASPYAGIADQLLAVPGENFGGPVGTFYLCVDDNGKFTPIDNRPLVLEDNQLMPMELPQPERRDILEAALANSDVFHAEPVGAEAPDFRDLNANVSVHCRVSETSSVLHQPIMTPVELPSKAAVEPAVPASLEDGLAVIGVTPHCVPTSLELPITITDPRIAPRAADPLGGARFGAPPLPSPGAELFEAGAGMGSISMPLLTDDEAVGKSMPSLTDEVAMSAGSAGSAEDDGWARRLLTSGSDTSEAEIPLQLSVGALGRRS